MKFNYSYVSNWNESIFIRKFDDYGNPIDHSQEVYWIRDIFTMVSSCNHWNDILPISESQPLTKLDGLLSIGYKFHLNLEDPNILMEEIDKMTLDQFSDCYINKIKLSDEIEFPSDTYTVLEILDYFDLDRADDDDESNSTSMDEWIAHKNDFIFCEEDRITALEALLTVADYLDLDIPNHYEVDTIISTICSHLIAEEFSHRDKILILYPPKTYDTTELLQLIDQADSWDQIIANITLVTLGLDAMSIRAVDALQMIATIYGISLDEDQEKTPDSLWHTVLNYFAYSCLSLDQEIFLHCFSGYDCSKALCCSDKTYLVKDVLNRIDQANSWDDWIDEEEEISALDGFFSLAWEMNFDLPKDITLGECECMINQCIFQSFNNIKPKRWGDLRSLLED